MYCTEPSWSFYKVDAHEWAWPPRCDSFRAFGESAVLVLYCLAGLQAHVADLQAVLGLLWCQV